MMMMMMNKKKKKTMTTMTTMRRRTIFFVIKRLELCPLVAKGCQTEINVYVTDFAPDKDLLARLTETCRILGAMYFQWDRQLQFHILISLL